MKFLVVKQEAVNQGSSVLSYTNKVILLSANDVIKL